jgi:hypothetical protein
MMLATAGRSPARLAPKAVGGFDTSVEGDSGAGPLASLSRIPAGAPIRRKCAACDQDNDPAMSLSPKLEVGAIDDPAEREADVVADRVMASDGGGSTVPVSNSAAPAPIRQKTAGGVASSGGKGTATVGGAPAKAIGVLGSGEAMSASDRAFFEPRLRQDLSHVRLHRGAQAEAAAAGIGARAFTIGSNIVMGQGEYGSSQASRHLMAHELAHVQQNDGVVRMTEIEIVDAGTTGKLSANQRRAAVSCPINCGGTEIGSFHAMPIFFSNSRGAPPLTDSKGSNGIGAMLHFIQNSSPLPQNGKCGACNEFKVIQVIKTNQSSDSRKKESYVDNAGNNGNPYYTDVGSSGSSEHIVGNGAPNPAMFVDGGKKVKTTTSIYDIPFRSDSKLTAIKGSDFFWEGEACVTCVNGGTRGSPSPDRVLGCVKYGFTRPWLSPSKSYGDAIATGPTCGASPSKHFVDTLHNDPSTSGKYWFRI